MKRHLRLVWTCCDACHAEHRTLLAARWHHALLRALQWLRGSRSA